MLVVKPNLRLVSIHPVGYSEKHKSDVVPYIYSSSIKSKLKGSGCSQDMHRQLQVYFAPETNKQDECLQTLFINTSVTLLCYTISVFITSGSIRESGKSNQPLV